VMGLSSYGTPRYLEEFAKVLRPAGISYELDEQLDKRQQDAEIFTSDFSTRQERIFTAKLEDLLGPAACAASPWISGSRTSRRAARSSSNWLRQRRPDGHRSHRLCRRLPCRRRRAELQNEHGDRGRTFGRETLRAAVPHDAGVALGAAMLKCAEAAIPSRPDTRVLGPEYSNDVIKDTLEKVGARYEVHDDPTTPCVADLTAQKTVGWFQDAWSMAAGAGKPIDHRGPALCGHEGPDQRPHQIREEFRLLPSCCSTARRSISTMLSTRRSWS